MIEAEIPPEELRELYIDLKGLHPTVLFQGKLGPFMRDIRDETMVYPPPNAESAYVRTDHLKGKWFYNVIDSLSAEVGNFAKYAGYVHGPGQVAVHRATGWKRLYEIGDEKSKAFIKMIEDKIDKIWRS
jgi:hypothetical protein